MALSIVPALIDALQVWADAQPDPGWRTVDGFGRSDDPGAVLMLGIGDPESVDMASSANGDRKWAYANSPVLDEEGDLTCMGWAASGDGDQKAARDQVYAMRDWLLGPLGQSPSLGLDGLMWALPGRDELLQGQTGAGAVARLTFQIHFRARF